MSSRRIRLLVPLLLGLSACAATAPVNQVPSENFADLAEPVAAGPAGAAATAQEQALKNMILRQLQPCLQEASPPMQNVNADEPIAVFFGFAPDGTLVGARLPDENATRYDADAEYREVVDTMIRSVQRCSPLTGMPEAAHEQWGVFPLVVQPQGV